MENDRNIQNQVEETLNVFDNIESVNVSPFFKHKTMQRMFAKKEEQKPAWSWFTPKVQWATFICLLALNIMAFTKINNTSTYDDNIEEFAESYGLSISTDETLNLN